MRYYEIIAEQKLDEIEKGGGLVVNDAPDDLPNRNFSSSQLDLFKEIPSLQPDIPANYKMVGRLGELFVAKRSNDGEYHTYAFFNGESAVGYVCMAAYDRKKTNYPNSAPEAPDLNGKGLRVHAVQVFPKFRGSNLGPKMYEWILHNVCDYIIADETQTNDGAHLWKRLLKMKDIFHVEVWDGDQEISRYRRPGFDWQHVYNKYHLIPWVTLVSKVDFVHDVE